MADVSLMPVTEADEDKHASRRTEEVLTSPILLTGGTGTLGKLVAARLIGAGCDLRVLSRGRKEPTPGVEHVTVDLLAGTGIDSAVAGIHTIVHLAGGPKHDDVVARNLVRAARGAGVQHVVLMSVIGADRMPLGYFRAKLAAEQAVAASGIPWTTLRAAQFHELCLSMAHKMSVLPVIPTPTGMRFQPIAAGDVAARIVELALDSPAGLVPELPGPDIHDLRELLRSYLSLRGKRRWMLPVRMPGSVGRAYRAGENLTQDQTITGTQTWEQFLHEQVPLARPTALCG